MNANYHGKPQQRRGSHRANLRLSPRRQLTVPPNDQGLVVPATNQQIATNYYEGWRNRPHSFLPRRHVEHVELRIAQRCTRRPGDGIRERRPGDGIQEVRATFTIRTTLQVRKFEGLNISGGPSLHGLENATKLSESKTKRN